jgi:hypothetical protein
LDVLFFFSPLVSIPQLIMVFSPLVSFWRAILYDVDDVRLPFHPHLHVIIQRETYCSHFNLLKGVGKLSTCIRKHLDTHHS